MEEMAEASTNEAKNANESDFHIHSPVSFHSIDSSVGNSGSESELSFSVILTENEEDVRCRHFGMELSC
jgi:hypothetical protein